MNKVAMYKEEIYKEAKLIPSQAAMKNKDGSTIDSRLLINRPLHRIFAKPSKYDTIARSNVHMTSPDMLEKIKNAEDGKKRAQLTRQAITESKSGISSGYRTPKPLLFGRKKHKEMAENPATTDFLTSDTGRGHNISVEDLNRMGYKHGRGGRSVYKDKIKRQEGKQNMIYIDV